MAWLPDGVSRELTLLVPMCGILAATWLAARWVDKRPISSLGAYGGPLWWRETGMGLATGFVLMASVFAYQYLAGWTTVTGFGWMRIGTTSFAWALLGYAWQMLLVGYYEELMSRAYQLTNLAEGLGRWWAVGLSAAVFAGLHASNPGVNWMAVAGVFLAGILLGLPYVLTGRLGFSFGLHVSWNFVQGAVFGYPVSGIHFRTSILQTETGGPEWLTGGAFGPEAGLIGHLVLLVAIIGVLKTKWAPHEALAGH